MRTPPLGRPARLLAGFACAACAMLLPWTDFNSEGVSIAGRPVGGAICWGGAAFIAAAGAGALLDLIGLLRRLPSRQRWAAAVVIAVTASTLAGAWFGYILPGRLVAYEYRGAARLALFSLATVLIAGALGDTFIRRVWTAVGQKLRKPTIGWWIAGAALVSVGGSAFVACFVLDAMPHIADGCSYLLQARMLAAGRPAIPSPPFDPLLAEDLLFVRTIHGYAPRGLWGYPALLAAAEPAHLAWLVNPVLAGLLVWLTWRYLARAVDRTTAATAAIILALCPWLWFNAATFMPHLASAVGLMLFVHAFDRARTTRSLPAAAGAGLALGSVVMIRFQDAAFFALPAIVWGLILLLRRPRLWLGPLAAVVVGVAPGLIGMIALNRWVTGGNISSYAGGLDVMDHGGFFQSVVATLTASAPASVGMYLAWLHESITQFSSHWFAGAFPAVPLLLTGLWLGRRTVARLGVFMLCSLSLLVLYGLFVFGGRSWVGPRWYLPLLPAAAFVMAAGLTSVARLARGRAAAAAPARRYLATITAVLAVTWLAAAPANLLWRRQHPPHGVDARLVRAVETAGLADAVVAVPVEGLEADGATPNYKWLRTAAWSMAIPLTESPVIYVRAVPDWAGLAAHYWPNRGLYRVSSEPGCFDLIPAAAPHTKEPSTRAR